MIPSNPSPAGEARLPASDGDDTFATLLDAEEPGSGTPAAATTPQTYSTLSPALQLQTLVIEDPAVTTATSTAPTAPTDASGQPAAVVAQLDSAAAALMAPDANAAVTLAVATQQPAMVVATAGASLQAAVIAPEADVETPEAAAQTIVEGAVIPAATGPSPAPALVAPVLSGIASGAQASTEAGNPVAQPVAPAPDSAPTPDAPAADATDAAPANPGGRAAAAQTPNQPAAAAAAQPPAPTADTTAAKPDFAAMLASQSAQGADGTTQASSATSETARATPTPAALQSAPAATIQVYNRIIERADGRAQRFEIRLDPAELGRVDVRIEIGADRKVHAVLAAHDSAALSDLMRGQRALERALADAGIDLADNGVRFELARDNGGSANQRREPDGQPTQAGVWRRFDTMTMPATDEIAAAVQPSWRPQRLDLVA